MYSGGDSWTGSSALRLHIAAGGSTSVQSDPIPVSPNTDNLVTSRMRFNLASTGNIVRFSIIQLDGAGNQIESNEVSGVSGDNFWSWQPKRLKIHTATDAASVRVQFYLAAAGNSYMDVDSVRRQSAADYKKKMRGTRNAIAPVYQSLHRIP